MAAAAAQRSRRAGAGISALDRSRRTSTRRVADPRLARGRRHEPRAIERIRACAAPLRPGAAGARLRADLAGRSHTGIGVGHRSGVWTRLRPDRAKPSRHGHLAVTSYRATGRSPSGTNRRCALPRRRLPLRATAWDQAVEPEQHRQACERRADDALVATSSANRFCGRAFEANAPFGDPSSDAGSGERSRSGWSSSVHVPTCATASASPSPGAWRIATGEPVPGAQVQVFAGSATDRGQVVGAVTTDASGGFSYETVADASRTLRFVYSGSPVTLPAETAVSLLASAASTIRATPRRLKNGQSVRFAGRLRALPAPPAGKLVELQVVLSGRWQTFRTTRTQATDHGPSGTPSDGLAACCATGSVPNCLRRPATRSRLA